MADLTRMIADYALSKLPFAGRRQMADAGASGDSFYPPPGSTIDSLLQAWVDGTSYPLFQQGFGGASRYIHRDIAASYAAVYRCAALVATTVAGLPVNVIDADSKKPVEPSDTMPGRVAEMLLMGPDGHMPVGALMENITLDLALDGNFYLAINKDPMGYVTGLKLCNPWGGEIYAYQDARTYFLVDEEGDQHWLHESEVIHGLMPRVWRRSQGYQTRSAGRFKGVAPIQAVRPALEIALESDRYTARFFRGDAVHNNLAISPKMPFENEAQKDQAVDLLQRYATSRTQMPLLFPNADFHQLDSSQQHRALASLREFQVAEIARAYGIPPPLIGINTTQWGSGIAELSKLFIHYCLSGYMQRIERMMTFRLLPYMRGQPRYEIRFDDTELLRADMATLADALVKLIGGTQNPGMITLNEARRWMGLPLSPDGDLQTMQTSAQSADDAG